MVKNRVPVIIRVPCNKQDFFFFIRVTGNKQGSFFSEGFQAINRVPFIIRFLEINRVPFFIRVPGNQQGSM